jgi:hypothetical protein
VFLRLDPFGDHDVLEALSYVDGARDYRVIGMGSDLVLRPFVTNSTLELAYPNVSATDRN